MSRAGSLIVGSLTMLFLAGCEMPAAEAPGDAGTITGVVRLGPIMPVCQQGVPCDGVYKGAKVVVRRQGGGAGVLRTIADDAGAFQVSAAPGTYSVGVEVEGMLPRCTPVDATVGVRETVRVTVDCDSGIR